MVLRQECSFQCSCLAKAYHLNIDKKQQHHVTLPLFDGRSAICLCALCLMNTGWVYRFKSRGLWKSKSLRHRCFVCKFSSFLPLSKHITQADRQLWIVHSWMQIYVYLPTWPCDEHGDLSRAQPCLHPKIRFRIGSNSPSDPNFRRRDARKWLNGRCGWLDNEEIGVMFLSMCIFVFVQEDAECSCQVLFVFTTK